MDAKWPCHRRSRDQWCDRDGPGGFMVHTCVPSQGEHRQMDIEQARRDHPELEEFTRAMAIKLHARKNKLEAPKLPPAALLRLLRIEVEELAVALEFQTPEDVKAEAVDVANYAMLIFKRMQQ